MTIQQILTILGDLLLFTGGLSFGLRWGLARRQAVDQTAYDQAFEAGYDQAQHDLKHGFKAINPNP